MTLTSFSETIKKYLWLTPFIVGAIVVGLLFLVKYAPKSEKIQKITPITTTYLNINARQFNINNLKIEGKEEKSLQTYNASDTSSFLDKTNDFANILKVKGEEVEIKESVFGPGKRIIAKDASVLQIYKNNFLIAKSGKKGSEIFLPDDQLLSKTKLFFEELSLNTPIQYDVFYSHSIGEFSYEDKTPSGANFISLKFIPLLQNTKIYSPNQKTSALFNKNGDIISAAYSKHEFTPSGTKLPLITAREALRKININTQPVKIYGEGELYVKTKQTLESVSLTNSYLAYFLPDKGTNTLKPVWVFEAESEVSKKKLFLEYAVDATNQKYLISN